MRSCISPRGWWWWNVPSAFHYTCACVRFSLLYLLWQFHFWHLDEDEELCVQIHFRHLDGCKNFIFVPWKRKAEISTFKYLSFSTWVCLISRHLSQLSRFYTWMMMMMMKCCFKFTLSFLHICLREWFSTCLVHLCVWMSGRLNIPSSFSSHLVAQPLPCAWMRMLVKLAFKVFTFLASFLLMNAFPHSAVLEW